MKAFEEVFLTHYQALINLGMRICAEKEFVKDVIQLFFLELWEKEVFLSAIEYPRAYLLKSFYRKMYHELRKQGRRETAYLDEIQDVEGDAFDEILKQEEEQAELQQQLFQALATLPEKEQTMFRMRHIEGLEYEEIAQYTGKSKQTVYNQIHTATQRLRTLLAHFSPSLKKN